MDYQRELSFGLFPVPAVEDAKILMGRVQLAERVGFDLVGIQDHPYKGDYLDTWSLLCYLGGATSRIKLFPDVINLPLRPPAVLGQAAATIDVLTGGRFELGLGAGGFADQIAAMGGPHRVGGEALRGLEEGIDVIRLMWSEQEKVSYAGKHYQLHDLETGPLPAHGIGIHLGVYKARMLELVGRKADGWVPSSRRLGKKELVAGNAVIDDAARSTGREPSAIRRFFNITGMLAKNDVDDPYNGGVAKWTEELSLLALEAGIDTFVLWLSGDVETQIERFGNEVFPAVREQVRGGAGGIEALDVPDPVSLYDRVGGSPFFFRLVDAFYENVANDAVLRRLYPDDLGPPRERLALFLIQLWGGPTDYLDRRGHPRLRLRHLEFDIDKRARDAWMEAMHDALGRQQVSEEIARELTQYFEKMATFLINKGLSLGAS